MACARGRAETLPYQSCEVVDPRQGRDKSRPRAAATLIRSNDREAPKAKGQNLSRCSPALAGLPASIPAIHGQHASGEIAACIRS
jgi:hypothetical protein